MMSTWRGVVVEIFFVEGRGNRVGSGHKFGHFFVDFINV